MTPDEARARAEQWIRGQGMSLFSSDINSLAALILDVERDVRIEELSNFPLGGPIYMQQAVAKRLAVLRSERENPATASGETK